MAEIVFRTVLVSLIFKWVEYRVFKNDLKKNEFRLIYTEKSTAIGDFGIKMVWAISVLTLILKLLLRLQFEWF